MRQRRREAKRLDLAAGTPPRGPPCFWADKTGNICPAPLYICRIVCLLLRQRRGVAGNCLGATIPYLRQTTSGNGLGITIKYLQQTTSGAAGNGLGATIKYLRRTVSGTADYGLGATIKYLHGAAGIGLGATIK
jgi:hypothetical protein